MTRSDYANMQKDIESDALLVDLFIAASTTNNPEEAGLFLSALLTPKELGFLARRLRIAILLSLGYPYSTIQKALTTGPQTIAKVGYWLEAKEENYKMVIQRFGETGQINKILGTVPECRNGKGLKSSPRSSSKYSECFWPVEVIGAILRGLNGPKDE